VKETGIHCQGKSLARGPDVGVRAGEKKERESQVTEKRQMPIKIQKKNLKLI
jgi:hypothetical protein